MNESKSGMKAVFIIVLLLIVLPLILLVLVQFAPRKEAPSSEGAVASGAAEAKTTAAQERRARRENRATRQETTVEVETVPEPAPVFEEVGAISPYATRGKQATPYPPDQVPGDSGIIVQYAGSPDDPMSGPVPPPQDDLWDGQTLPPIPPENMGGIGGVRRVDPNDPFFRQDIPNPFNN